MEVCSLITKNQGFYPIGVIASKKLTSIKLDILFSGTLDNGFECLIIFLEFLQQRIWNQCDGKSQ